MSGPGWSVVHKHPGIRQAVSEGTRHGVPCNMAFNGDTVCPETENVKIMVVIISCSKRLS